jgi:DNA repair exonuclease SbcCD ATPase subunit
MDKESEDEEYELIPMSPLRRLEKRIDKVESNTGTHEVIREIIDIVRMNQQIVDELAKSNDALRIELAKLPAKIDELVANMREIISFIKSSGEEENVGITKEAMKPLVEKFDEMINTNKSISEKNDSMLDLLDDISKKIKRPMIRPLPGRTFLPGSTTQPTQPLRRPEPI